MTTNDVRVEIYRSFVHESRAPSAAEIGERLGIGLDQVEASLDELHAGDVIVLHTGTHEIWLAHPFCNAPAPFETTAGDRRWDAICIWDALGILAVIGADGTVTTACPDCGESLQVNVAGGEVEAPSDYVVHYGVPAARWYEDVAYT